MAVTLSSIETLTRYLVGDFSRTQKDVFTHANSSVYTLTEDNPISVTVVLVNDVELASGDWSFSSSTGKVTITASLTSGDTIEIQYTHYSNFSSTEVQSFIHAAIGHISAANYYTWVIKSSTIYPEPSTKDQNLISMVASVLIEPDNKTLRLPDITINTPSDLPTHDKIRKIIAVCKHNTHGIFFLG